MLHKGSALRVHLCTVRECTRMHESAHLRVQYRHVQARTGTYRHVQARTGTYRHECTRRHESAPGWNAKGVH